MIHIVYTFTSRDSESQQAYCLNVCVCLSVCVNKPKGGSGDMLVMWTTIEVVANILPSFCVFVYSADSAISRQQESVTAVGGVALGLVRSYHKYLCASSFCLVSFISFLSLLSYGELKERDKEGAFYYKANKRRYRLILSLSYRFMQSVDETDRMSSRTETNAGDSPAILWL